MWPPVDEHDEDDNGEDDNDESSSQRAAKVPDTEQLLEATQQLAACATLQELNVRCTGVKDVSALAACMGLHNARGETHVTVSLSRRRVW